MSKTAHLEALIKKHKELDNKIQNCQNMPAEDDIHLRNLKKEKLLLKEQISTLENA